MKILMGSNYYVSHRGGLEIVAGALYLALAERGHEVVWMAGDVTPPPEPVGKSRAVSLPIFNFVEKMNGLPVTIPTPGALRKIICEVGNADILILHDCLYLSNIFSFLVARLRGIPVVIIQHTRFFPNSTFLINAIIWFAYATVARIMLSHTAQVVFIGQTAMDSYSHLHYKRPPELIFNGVNTDIFRKLEGSETVSALRREYGLPEGGTVILFVGRFVVKKGIAAMKRMVDQRPDWTWAFAGWGPLDPAKWNGANVRVFYSLEESSIALLYRCCDLLVLPSTGEGGFPLAAREALASGIPVVCGEETLGADLAMGEFVTGIPVYQEDDDRTAREFLSAIDNVLACGAKLDQRFEERKSLAVLQCSWQRASERYMEILSRLAPQTTSDAVNSEAGAKERRS